MRLVLILFFLYSNSLKAIDTGDGSDGVCNVTGGADTQISSAKKSYQCTSLVIDANLNDFRGDQAGRGGAILLIKVQGNVTVNAGVTLDLSGEAGIDGNNIAGVKAGGRAGAGGSDGGSSPGLLTTGANGSGSGAGSGGTFVAINTGVSSYGGGGGGGSYKTQGATASSDGEDVGGTGSIFGSKGASGNIFGDENNFDTSFVGGSGGGAGGGGDTGVSSVSGSTGGGGGGAIRIVAGGNITIDGSIISKGGNGGGAAGTASSGGGGGGSGGAIWLQAAGELTVSASGVVTALGGSQGQNDGGVGLGGEGGNGRIRLDDGNGVITNNGTVSPAAVSTSFIPSAVSSGSSSLSRQYSSSVSCGKIILDNESRYNNKLNFIFNFLLGFILIQIFVIPTRALARNQKRN